MDNFLRFNFSKDGKVTIYAEFPKGMQLKGREFGQWPELSLDIAREKAQETAKERLTAESVPRVINRYKADPEARVKRHKLSTAGYHICCCCLKHVEDRFGRREVCCDVKYIRLMDIPGQ